MQHVYKRSVACLDGLLIGWLCWVYCIVLQHLYLELGVELPERQYGTDCRLYIPGQGINWQVGWLAGGQRLLPLAAAQRLRMPGLSCSMQAAGHRWLTQLAPIAAPHCLPCTVPCVLPVLQTLHDTVWDEFVVAHTLGWWGKALIIRNHTML
jgi:hypothetical protein